MATIMCPENRPQMGTVRPAVFKKGAYDEAKTGEIVKEEITVAADEIRTTLIEQPCSSRFRLDAACTSGRTVR